ncbi:MAG: hypothetical protein ACRETA_11640 [Gammaproteobacteria bacterium]
MLASTAETIIAVTSLGALIVAIIALRFTIKQGAEQLKQLRYASVPAIMTEVHYEHTIEEKCAGLALRNSGNGAAIVESIIVTYHHDKLSVMEPVNEPMWAERFLTELDHKGIPRPIPASFTTGYVREGGIFAAGRLFWLISKQVGTHVAINTVPMPPNVTNFDDFIKQLEVQVKYKSLYGKQYSTDTPYNADGNI